MSNSCAVKISLNAVQLDEYSISEMKAEIWLQFYTYSLPNLCPILCELQNVSLVQ